jgi:hypothetical protein
MCRYSSKLNLLVSVYFFSWVVVCSAEKGEVEAGTTGPTTAACFPVGPTECCAPPRLCAKSRCVLHSVVASAGWDEVLLRHGGRENNTFQPPLHMGVLDVKVRGVDWGVEKEVRELCCPLLHAMPPV